MSVVGEPASCVQAHRVVSKNRACCCVSVADFRDIDLEHGQPHGEGLFRAAISAFAGLPHASAQEAEQLDDLAMAMADQMPRAALRFAAAALSRSDPAPRRFILSLAGELPDISAPILLHSPALGEVDLIALIARHGLPHARLIARRQSLHPAIAALARALLSGTGEDEPAPAAPEE